MNRQRQQYATKVAQHYQRLGLQFVDVLAFFRLAGKTYDKNHGARNADAATTCGSETPTLRSTAGGAQ